MKKSELESYFELLLRSELGEGIPKPTPQYRFNDTRKWLWDFAWPTFMVALEIQGGTHSGGRHVRGKGYAEDCEKHNTGIADGWRVLWVPGDTLKNEGQKVLELLRKTLDTAASAW